MVLSLHVSPLTTHDILEVTMAQQKELELEKLKEQVLKMGGFVEGAIQKSIKALVERDRDLALSVIAGDAIVNAYDVEIEEDCIRLLAICRRTAANSVSSPRPSSSSPTWSAWAT